VWAARRACERTATEKAATAAPRAAREAASVLVASAAAPGAVAIKEAIATDSAAVSVRTEDDDWASEVVSAALPAPVSASSSTSVGLALPACLSSVERNESRAAHSAEAIATPARAAFSSDASASLRSLERSRDAMAD
jgi:hypothetical protein